MSGTTVDFDAMKMAAGHFGDGVNDCNHVLAGVSAELSALSGRWSGQAATTFGGVMGEWSQHYRRIIVALDAMKDTLSRNNVNYDRNEYDSVAISSGLGSTLSGAV